MPDPKPIPLPGKPHSTPPVPKTEFTFFSVWELHGHTGLGVALEGYHGWMWPYEQINVHGR